MTGITQVTRAKVLGIQNQRIAQCRYAKITMHGPDKLPMQVDGEAWLQEPGIIVVSHKNKARIIFKNKVREQSMHTYVQRSSFFDHRKLCFDDELQRVYFRVCQDVDV